MNSRRRDMAAVELNGKLFVAGGYNYNEGALSSTEFISPEGMVTSGPDLPVPWDSHCMTKLPSGNVVFIGGNGGSSRSVIEFDPVTNSFQDLPSLSSKRSYLACAIFKSPIHNGRPVLLAAGGTYGTYEA